jgi:hypothetical protein
MVAEDSGDGIFFDGEGVGGNGLLLCGGLGLEGTVSINDLKDRTGLSIPSSEVDDLLPCKKGNRTWFSFIPGSRTV